VPEAAFGYWCWRMDPTTVLKQKNTWINPAKFSWLLKQVDFFI
jgi:hypothetical protein